MTNIIACLLLLASAASAELATGGYAGAFMKIPVEARPAAMGGAYAAVSNDAAGQLYNPAGVAAIRDKIFVSSYRAMTLDRKMGFVSFLLPTRKESAIGLSWQFVGSGGVDVRNRDGDNMGITLTSNEHIFALTFSKQFSPFLGLGAKLGYYIKHGGTPNSDYNIIYDLGASSIGINLGGMLYVDSLFDYGTMDLQFINDIKIGLVFENLAANYSWSSKDSPGLVAAPEDQFPIIAKGGVSFKVFQRKLLIAADLDKVEKRPATFKIGGEFNYDGKAALRAGLDDGKFTAGLGYQFEFNGAKNLGFNYAFSSDKVGEGSDHLFGFQLKF